MGREMKIDLFETGEEKLVPGTDLKVERHVILEEELDDDGFRKQTPITQAEAASPDLAYRGGMNLNGEHVHYYDRR